MDKMKELYELCETISDSISEANDKIRSAGGKLSAGDVDYVDKLTHALKSVKATMAMMEDEGEYSNYYPMFSYEGRSGQSNNMGRSYRGGSYRGGSYARGRGRYARRDSMGRYSSEGYSRDGDMIEELRELAEDAPNEQIKREMHRLIEKIEQMQ